MVGQAAAGKAFHMIMEDESLPADLASFLLPMAVRMLNSTQSNVLYAWLQTICAMAPKLPMKMAADLSEEDMQILIDAYKSLACHQNEEVSARKYAMGLDVAYLQLIQDSSPYIRSIIATSFHEVSKILGKERTAMYLKDPFFMLLQDSSNLVQISLITTLQHVIGQFSVTNDHQKLAIYTSIMPYLLQIDKSVSSTNHWRLQLSLLETYAQLPDYLTSDQIYENFVPICFHYMTEGVLPVRKGAAHTLAKFIRNNCRALQRYELSLRVVKEFGLGRSYWSRLVYLDFCESMLRVSSTHMFKEYFLDAAILSLQDGVASVRMRACLLLPLLKAAIKLPDDISSLERINFFATQRLNDINKEVAAAARSISDLFKNATVRCIGFEPGTETYTNQAEFETMDKQREDEELHMLSKHEQDEKKRLDETLQKLKLDPSKKNASIVVSASCITKSDSFSRRTGKAGGNTEKYVNVHSRSLPRVKSASGMSASTVSTGGTTLGAVNASPNNVKASHQGNHSANIMSAQFMKALTSTKSAFSTVMRPSSSHGGHGSSSSISRSSSAQSDYSDLPTLSFSSSMTKVPSGHKASPRCTKKTS